MTDLVKRLQHNLDIARPAYRTVLGSRVGGVVGRVVGAVVGSSVGKRLGIYQDSIPQHQSTIRGTTRAGKVTETCMRHRPHRRRVEGRCRGW
jgi:hypothetical protein